MADCTKCGAKIRWATVSNGKFAGKKRPFDVEGKTEGGHYGLTDSGEVNQYGKPEFKAAFYDDPMEGFERHDLLYENHFDTCTEKFVPGSKNDRAVVTIELNGAKYSGSLNKITSSAISLEDVSGF